MRSRFLGTAIALVATITVAGELAPSAVPELHAQDFRDRLRIDDGFTVSRLYDRVTDRTRVATALSAASRPFGLGSRVWLLASFTYPGGDPRVRPTSVVLSLESWSPTRSGWAFAKPRELRVETGKTRLATIPPARYVKRPVHLFDQGRHEELSFQIGVEELTVLAQQPELMLRAGSAKIRLNERRMGRLRSLLQEIGLPARGESR